MSASKSPQNITPQKDGEKIENYIAQTSFSDETVLLNNKQVQIEITDA